MRAEYICIGYDDSVYVLYQEGQVYRLLPLPDLESVAHAHNQTNKGFAVAQVVFHNQEFPAIAGWLRSKPKGLSAGCQIEYFLDSGTHKTPTVRVIYARTD